MPKFIAAMVTTSRDTVNKGEMASTTSGVVYKYRFVSEPSDAHKCPICLEVAEEPWQHGDCGRLFCKACLDKYGKDKPCAHCRMKPPQYFKDNKSEWT